MRPTFTTPERVEALAQDLRIWDSVARITVAVERDEREMWVDVEFFGAHPSNRSAVETDLQAAGFDLVDSTQANLGLYQRWAPCVPVQWGDEVPEMEPPSAAELAHWSAVLAEEAITEGRIHRKAPLNIHGD